MTEEVINVEEIIKKYSNLIKKVIKETSPQADQCDIDDIEQEIYIIIWKEFIKSEKKIHYPYSYIRRIAFTTTSRMMKSVSRRRLVFVPQVEDNKAQPDSKEDASSSNKLSEKEIMEIIKEAIDKLAEPRNKVLKLHILGMHLKDIADFLKWSEGKVRNLLYRGLKDLKEILKKEGIEYNF